jgi:hypothetical protein
MIKFHVLAPPSGKEIRSSPFTNNDQSMFARGIIILALPLLWLITLL